MPTVDPSSEPRNPLGIRGVEFIEYATSQPQAFGALLQKLGFAAVARHRSREVVLYRQGDMNLIVNADPDALPRGPEPRRMPVIAAFALRVRDAGAAFRRCTERGAWEIPTRASAMELNIPGIHGVGDSVIYFVDRHEEFSIYDVDFVPLPGADPAPAPLHGLHYFGLVQTIQPDRTPDWIDFYGHLFDFSVLPEGRYFGVVPKGTLLESPCRDFWIQLVEPPPGAEDVHWDEGFVRLGLGAPDVPAAARALESRGIAFVDHGPHRLGERGALTQFYLGGVTFELVASRREPQP